MGLAARSRNRTGIGTANPLYKLEGGPRAGTCEKCRLKSDWHNVIDANSR